IGGDLGCALISIARSLLHHSIDYLDELPRRVRAMFLYRRGLGFSYRLDRLKVSVAVKRKPSRSYFIKDNAERKDVRKMIDFRSPRRLFRRHVAHRAQQNAGLGQTRLAFAAIEHGQRFCQTKVSTLTFPFAVSMMFEVFMSR